MYTLYGDSRSGHCYKIRLLCSLLNIDYQWVEVDLLKKEHLNDAFLAISPQHKVPALVINDSTTVNILLESNAIMHYLANRHAKHSHYPELITTPSNLLTYTKVLQWQFYEQSQFQPPVSFIRFVKLFLQLPKERLTEYEEKLATAQTNFAYLDNYLADKSYLVNNTLTLADISLFVSAHFANDGGIELTDYPNIEQWLQRIKALDGFVAMSQA